MASAGGSGQPRPGIPQQQLPRHPFHFGHNPQSRTGYPSRQFHNSNFRSSTNQATSTSQTPTPLLPSDDNLQALPQRHLLGPTVEVIKGKPPPIILQRTQPHQSQPQPRQSQPQPRQSQPQPLQSQPQPLVASPNRRRSKPRSRPKKNSPIPNQVQNLPQVVSGSSVQRGGGGGYPDGHNKGLHHREHQPPYAVRPQPQPLLHVVQPYKMMQGAYGGQVSKPNSSNLRQSYSRLFYSMLDNPSVQVRRESMHQNFQRLSLTDQLAEMQESLSLTPEEHRLRLSILNDIEVILRKEYPNVCIFPFGSYLTGLGDMYSDVDIYVDAFGVSAGHKLPRTGSGTISVLERCHGILRRAKCPSSFKAFCKNSVPIKDARVPILKITHWTDINIDLSFENLASLRNSEMIKLYMKLDPCVQPLMVLIRYWGKFHELTGSNAIKNYCLILMVLVFLQNRKKIVPSVANLQRLRDDDVRRSVNANPQEKIAVPDNDIIEGWDTGFGSFETVMKHGKDLLSPSTGVLVDTVLKLAKEFFEMYMNMDFYNFVICSKTAELLPVTLFKAGNEEDLPDSLEKYKDWAVQQPSNKRLNIRTPLIVQDPFILSFNVGAVTHFTTLLKFQVACRETFHVLQKGVTSLLQLFTPLPKEVGDRKFLSMQDKQRETIKLKEHINHFMKFGEFPSESNEVADLNRYFEELSPGRLSLHLQPVNEIIDKNTVRYGKGWESLALLLPSEAFQTLFANTMLQHKMQNKYSNRVLFEKLKVLWLSILNDFLAKFWTECYMLHVTKEEKLKKVRFYAEAPFGMRTQRNCESIFTERKRNRQNGPRLPVPVIPQDKIDILHSKLVLLGDIEEKIVCIKLSCSTCTPVWQKRMKMYTEIMEEEELKSKDVKDVDSGLGHSKPRHQRNTRSSIRKGADDVNPLDIQTRITNMVLEQSQGSNYPAPTKQLLSFTVFIKIDSSIADDVPVTSLVCETAGNTPTNIYNQAVSNMVETLIDVFEPYSIYRLKQWINHSEEPSNDDPDTSNDLVRDENDDFNSLMPPTPSSSECSSPADDLSFLVSGEWDD